VKALDLNDEMKTIPNYLGFMQNFKKSFLGDALSNPLAAIIGEDDYIMKI